MADEQGEDETEGQGTSLIARQEGAAEKADGAANDGWPTGKEEEYGVDDALDYMGFGALQLLMLAYTGIAWMGDGMEMLVLSFLGPSAHCEWGISPEQESALSSAVFLGMMIGAPLWGGISDVQGRKHAFFATAFATFAFGMASAVSPSYWALLVSRALVGFGLGGVPIAFSLFLEFLPSAGRGKMGVVIELFWTIGSITEAGLAWALLPTQSWRILLVVSAIPLIVLISAFPVIPESAHFLSSQGERDKAAAVLGRVSRINKRSLPPGKLKKLSMKRDEVGFNLRGIKKLLLPEFRVTTSLVWSIFFGVAFSYYGLVLLATKLNLVSEGPDEGKCEPHSAPRMSTWGYVSILVTAIAEIPGLLLAGILVDKIGRKRSLTTMMSICSVCFLLLAIEQAGTLATVVQFAARASAMASFTLSYIYVSEVYPTSVRSLGTGMANGFARIGGMVAPYFAVELIEIGSITAALVVFCLIAAGVAICSILMPVETMNKSLQEENEPKEVEMEPQQTDGDADGTEAWHEVRL